MNDDREALRDRGWVRDALEKSLLDPVRAMRWRYLPLLMIYFAYGASGVTGIAESFWIKEELGLQAEALVAIGVWLSVPWTVKMVFGQLVDGVAIFGSRRHVYVFMGASLVATGYVLLAMAAGHRIAFASPEAMYVTASILSVLGFVIQDVVADTMSTEVVARTDENGVPRAEEDVRADLGMVQVLGRLSLMLGLFLTSYIGGWLAQHFDRETVFWIGLCVPVLSMLGAIFVRPEVVEAGPVDWRVLGGGLVFGAFTVTMGLGRVPYGQEIVFAVSMLVVLVLLRVTIADIDARTRRTIWVAALVIFVFRAMPNVGPAGQWWQIDVLGFDEEFFGRLAAVGSLLAIAGMWFGSDLVTRKPVTSVLAGLTVVGTLLSLPTVGMFYGLHEWTQQSFGFGARTIALVDTAVSSPFAQLSMIPMLTLIAVNAPAGRRATWFALMASLMNLALSAAGLCTKYLNRAFEVPRGQYEALGWLMIVVIATGFIVPLLTIASAGRWLGDTRVGVLTSDDAP
jgi:MFS family permease